MTSRIIGSSAGRAPRHSGVGGFLRILAGLFAPALILAGGLAVPRACAGEIPGSAAEPEVKAAYLLNFARFVEWPDSAFEKDASEIRVGVLGPGPLDRPLKLAMEERLIRGRPIRVIWLDGPEAAISCHIVYVPQVAVHPEGIMAATAGRPILTVGESDSFAARGGVIQLYVEDEVVRFEINRAAAERNGLKVSSRLLSLARLTPVATGRAPGTVP
jgi:hypothetical protein